MVRRLNPRFFRSADGTCRYENIFGEWLKIRVYSLLPSSGAMLVQVGLIRECIRDYDLFLPPVDVFRAPVHQNHHSLLYGDGRVERIYAESAKQLIVLGPNVGEFCLHTTTNMYDAVESSFDLNELLYSVDSLDVMMKFEMSNVPLFSGLERHFERVIFLEHNFDFIRGTDDEVDMFSIERAARVERLVNSVR